MIPKVIHYCWFGGKPLPSLVLKCIESWKKFCPNYEIKRWDETNFDINCGDYVHQAYECKKWAFVSDYVRFYVLYHEGGVYLDTDVELIRSIDDILEKGPFMGFEGPNSGINLKDTDFKIHPDFGFELAPGLGCANEKGNRFIKEILDCYDRRKFILPDGREDLTSVCLFVTKLFKNCGLKNDATSISKIQNIAGFNLYPIDYFCPISMGDHRLRITKNTRAIHHYVSSWVGGDEAFDRVIIYGYIKRLPQSMRISKFLAICKNRGIVAAFKDLGLWIRRKITGEQPPKYEF